MRRARSLLPALQRAFTETFAGSHGWRGSRPRGRPPIGPYGLRVRSASRDLRHIDFAFGYLAGEQYPCCETHCAVPYHRGTWWRALRQSLERQGLAPPAGPITLHVAVIMEPGATYDIFGGEPYERFYFDEETWTETDARD